MFRNVDLHQSVTHRDFGWFTRVVAPDGFAIEHRSWLGDETRIEETRIEFIWRFDITPAGNTGVIKIYNLLPETVDHFQHGKLVRLEAGWRPISQHSLLVLHGTIVGIKTTELAPSKTVDIHIGDAPEVWNTKVVQHTWPRGVQRSTVFRDLAGMAGLPIRVFEPAQDGPYPRGLAVRGPLKYAMEMVAKDMRSKFYLYNRKFYLLPPGRGIDSNVVWDGRHGLFDLSQRIRVPQDGWLKAMLEGFDPAGWELAAELTPPIGPDTILRVESRDYQGRVRVVQGVHFSDGDRYATIIDAVPLGPNKVVISL